MPEGPDSGDGTGEGALAHARRSGQEYAFAAPEREACREHASHLSFPDRWLSGRLRTSRLGNLCLIHERKHDFHRPKDWTGHFDAALPSAIAIASFVSGSFLGNLVTQSRLRYSHRLIFGLITVLLTTIASNRRRRERWFGADS